MAKKNKLFDMQGQSATEQTDALLEMLTRKGLVKDPEIADEKIQKARQEYLRRAYHNTEVLLENYRMIQWILQCYPDEIAAELEVPLENIDALVDKMNIKACMDDKKIESRMHSATKTRLLMDRVNDALTVLKMKPKDGKQLYDIIYITYIQEEQWTHTQISEYLDISVRSYYRLRQKAFEIISTRLWSSPTADLDTWIEVLAFVEGKQ